MIGKHVSYANLSSPKSQAYKESDSSAIVNVLPSFKFYCGLCPAPSIQIVLYFSSSQSVFSVSNIIASKSPL